MTMPPQRFTGEALLPPLETTTRPRFRPRIPFRRSPAPLTHKAKPKPKKPFIAVLRQWHSRIGLTALFFLLWLAASGILLTRSVELGFDTARVDWPWLTEMYGLHAVPPSSGFRAGGHWLAQTNEFTVLDDQPLATQIHAPLGMVAAGDPANGLLFIAAPESLVLIDGDGNRIDEIRPPVLPMATIRRVGTLKADPRVVVVQDLDAYQSADEGNTWAPVSPTEVNWAQPSPLPQKVRDGLVDYAKPRIIVEQLLIDLHSGRLFGPVGAWTITLVGVLAILLSISGLWVWWRMRQNRQRNLAKAPAR